MFKNLPENRYIRAKKYYKGIVCFLDILGFSNFINSEYNFESAKQLFNSIMNIKINNDINSSFMKYKISINSDSIIITIKDSDDKEGTALFGIISLVCTIRDMVIRFIGTEIRCCITYGLYFHGGYQNQAYFGPAIIDAYMKAEKKNSQDKEKKFCFLELNEYFPNNPASILIDKNIKNRVSCSDYVLTYNNLMEMPYVKKINSGYMAINPYIFEFYKNKWSVNHFHEIDEEIFNRLQRKYESHLSSISEKFKEKYEFDKELFGDFNLFYERKISLANVYN